MSLYFNVASALKNLFPEKYHLSIVYFYKFVRKKLDPEMRLVLTVTPNRKRFIDIGANIGIYTKKMRKHFEVVEAFEPLTMAAKFLEKQNYENVNTHRVALSDKIVSSQIFIPVRNGKPTSGLASLSKIENYSEFTRLTVKTQTLDQYKFTDVDLVKIDVEGHELEVLKGGKKTITRYHPTLLVEIDAKMNRRSEDVFKMLKEMGYKPFVEDSGIMVELTNEQLKGFNNLFRISGKKKYRNNFIFVPTDLKNPDNRD